MPDLLPGSHAHFAASRTLMVDGQLRPSQVSDPRIVRLMRELARELFVPDEAAAIAYADRPVPLGGGRYLLEPRVLARMVQLAHPVAGERALVVAANSGFAAALLARLGLEVDATETDEALAARAEAAWRHPDIRAAVRLLPSGADFMPASDASEGGYALVLVDGGLEALDGPLGDALAALVRPEGGRLVAVLNRPGAPGRAILAERSGAQLAPRALFDAGAPTVPGFEKPRGFKF